MQSYYLQYLRDAKLSHLLLLSHVSLVTYMMHGHILSQVVPCSPNHPYQMEKIHPELTPTLPCALCYCLAPSPLLCDCSNSSSSPAGDCGALILSPCDLASLEHLPRSYKFLPELLVKENCIGAAKTVQLFGSEHPHEHL